jgi:hypothetical protein
MDTTPEPTKDRQLHESAGGLSRRAVLLMTPMVAASAATGMSGALAQTAPAASLHRWWSSNRGVLSRTEKRHGERPYRRRSAR